MNNTELLSMGVSLKEWLSLNASLQKRKNDLRKKLAKEGVLKREGNNSYDNYKYFSEAQYKQLMTRLFTEAGLEIAFSEIEYLTYEGTGKQNNGRMCRLEFTLTDTSTGFWENTIITGEAMDKGDKAGYKAYTGALKYYLANTFMVATGDDPEKDSPDEATTPAQSKKATKQARQPYYANSTPANNASNNLLIIIKKYINGKQDVMDKVLANYGVNDLNELTYDQALDCIAKFDEAARKVKEKVNG